MCPPPPCAVQGYVCRRPPLNICSEEQFLEDLVIFLSVLRGKAIERSRFPDAVLNGSALDLFNLYKYVLACARAHMCVCGHMRLPWGGGGAGMWDWIRSVLAGGHAMGFAFQFQRALHI